MFTSRFRTRAAGIVIILVMTLSSVQTAFAAPPANDDFANATGIGSLPYSDSIDTSEATAAADDPTTCTNSGSVWYVFTPSADVGVNANTFGSNYDTVLSVYTGTQGALTQIPGGCNDDFNGAQSRVSFTAIANTTYYFLIGVCCGTGGNGGGSLLFSVQELPAAPANDNFSNAQDITALPFSGSVNNTAATTESGEPQNCSSMPRTIWYKFTPPTTGFFTADMSGSSFYDNIFNTYQAVGTGFGGLNVLNCASFGGAPILHLVGGTTYYFQASDMFTGGGDLHFNLQVIPPPQPVVNFYFYPSDPSAFDTVQFCDQSSDPGGVGIQSGIWDFGDGTHDTNNCASHRYAADGDYTVQHLVTTFDGRSASTSQVVQVRTHDVAITKVTAPNSASVGQTRTIAVNLRNTTYPESVQIDLYKSVQGGFQWVATVTKPIPALSGNRTTALSFNYTFTSDDARIGKVTFKVVATIMGTRDALPADNEAISSPATKVGR